jgi:MBG domain (YGX type)/FG-GAP-like repeat/Viral BACON domain/Putative binding domain, N-terminal
MPPAEGPVKMRRRGRRRHIPIFWLSLPNPDVYTARLLSERVSQKNNLRIRSAAGRPARAGRVIMSRIIGRHVSILTLAIIAGTLGLAMNARAQCVNLSSVSAKVTPDGFAADLNDLDDWAIVMHCAISGTEQQARDARDIFEKRLVDKRDFGGNVFHSFLGGGSAAFAYATGIALRNRDLSTSQIDMILAGLDFVYEQDSSCGFTGMYHTSVNGPVARWRSGNNCMDDHTIGSEGFAWHAAYLKAIGDPAWTDKSNKAIEQFVASFDPEDSVCIYDGSPITDENTITDPQQKATFRGPCAAPGSAMVGNLVPGHPERVLALNHAQENGNYGLGLLTSLATASQGFKVAGIDINQNASFNAKRSDIDLILTALFLRAQQTSEQSGTLWLTDQCYFGTDHPYIETPSLPAFSIADLAAAHRNRPCRERNSGVNVTPDGQVDLGQGKPGDSSFYQPSMYPVRKWYADNGFTLPPLSATQYNFDGSGFPTLSFKIGEGDPVKTFFGWGRYTVYKIMTLDWPTGGLPPALTCHAADATITAPPSINSLASGTASVPSTAGATYAWSITGGTLTSDNHSPSVTFTANVSGAVTLTVLVTASCSTTKEQSVVIPINFTPSILHVDSVIASSGIPATYSATLFSPSFTPIANAELVFTLFGEEIGRPRTDANGHASVVHTVDVEPGSYPTINVSFAGDATNPPVSGSASLLVFCDSRSFIVRPEAFNFRENGGTVNVDIQTPGSCAWTATPSDTWINVSPTNGRGNGVLSITVQPSTTTRHGSVTLDGHVISIQQTVGCSYRFSPNGTYIAGDDDPNATSIMSVVAPDGCNWTVTTDHPEWLLLDTASGTGNNTIRFRVRQNDGGARVAHLTIPNNGNDVTTFVNQYAAPPCTAPHLEIDAMNGTVKDGSNVVVAPLFSGTRLGYTIWINGFPVVESGLGQFFAARWDTFWPKPGQSVTIMIIAHNACGSASSTPVTWTNVTAPDATCLVPEFFFHPSSFNSPFPGASVELGVTATGPFGLGDPSLTYQWYQGTTGDRSSKVFNGTNDFVFVNPTTTTRYWVEIKDDCGTNISLPGTVFVTSRPRVRAVSHDFNGDGMNDLVWHNEQTGQNELWSMSGTAHIGTVPLPAGDPHAELQSIGDFNGDSKPDLVFHDPATGANSVWEMNGTQLMSVQPLEPLPNWTIGAVADLDNDQNDDIVWHNGATGENQIWFQNGTQHTGTFSLPSSPDSNWGLHGAADFTHDGKPDLFFHNKVTGENAIWIMNDAQPVTTSSVATALSGAPASAAGVGSATSRRNIQATVQSIESQPDTNWVPAQIVDLNNDGNPDIVWRNTVTGENSVWIMSGMTHTDTQQLETRTDPAWQIGGGGSTNAGTQTTPPDSRTATTLSITADPASFNGATVITATLTTANGPIAGATLVFQLNGTEVARLATDDQGTVIAAASVAGIAAGTYSNAISVHFGGDTLRAPSDGSANLIVSGAQAVITWPYPAAITFGQALTATQLNATTNVPGTFVYSPAAGAVLNAGLHLLNATFTPSDPNVGAATKSAVIVVNKAGATITWPSPSPIAFGTPLSATQLNATASVAGTFTYNPTFGAMLSLGAQTLNVTFTPNDTLNYAPATSSTTINVIQGTQTIVWPAPQPITYGQPLTAVQLNASVVTAGGPPGGVLTYSPSAGTILPAGTQTLTVTAAATSFYTAATATRQIVVQPATPVINWSNPAAIVYGTPLGATQLNATSSVPGTFSYSPAAATILSGGAGQTLSVTFTPSDPSYTTASKSVTIDVLKAKPVITWATPAAIVYGTPLSATQFNATASVAGAFVYTPAAGTILNAGPAQTLSVQFTPAETNNYESASATTTIDVSKAQQTITWASPAPIVYGTQLSATQLNATAIGALTYTPPAGTVLQAGAAQTLTVNAAETPNYNAATASVTIDVLKATPVITWAKPASIVYGTLLGATQLSATANVAGSFVYTPPAGTQLDAGAQTLSTHFTPGDTHNYNDASASVAIDVAKAKQTLSWAPPAPIVYGTPLSATQLNAAVAVAGPSPAGTLVYAPAAGTVLDAGARTLTVTAQATANYESATTSVSIQVNRAPLSLTVDAKSKLYGGAVPALTGTLAGVVNGDAITPSYATIATQQSPTGSYPITGSLIDPNHRLVNYNATITPSTLTVLPAPLAISANPATKQYSDPLPQLTATFTGFVLGETPSVLSGTLSITTTAMPLSGPGSYPIAIGGLMSSNYAIVYTGSTLTVTPEDARVTITSPLLVSYATAKPTSITLSATVKDISATADAAGDVDPGDIRNASLAFVDRTTKSVLCTAPIGLVNASDERIGVATCTFTRNFPTGTSSLVVGAIVGNYYTRDDASENVTMTIAAPTGDSITGGGSTSGGAFNLNLQYDKSGNTKGGFTFKFQQNGRSYEISATNVDSLSIARSANGGTASIVGTATLRDVTKASDSIVIDDAAHLIAIATDDGQPATHDTLSVTLLKSGGGFWLATGWDGSRATGQLVTNGNIKVHYGN